MMRLLNIIEGWFFKPKNCYSSNSAPFSPSQQNPPSLSLGSQTVDAADNITLEGCESNTDEENKRIPLIQKELNRFIQSAEFASWILDSKNAVDLEQTEGLTLGQVLAKLQSSKAHLVVQFYYQRWTTVVGYRNPGSSVVFCNRKYHNNYTIAEEASNLAHEAAHIIDVTAPLCGFQHDFDPTPRRPFSVNYRINQAFEDLDDHE